MATHSIFALAGGTEDLLLALAAGAELARKGHDVWLHGTKDTGEAAVLEGIPFHEVDAEDLAGCIEAIAEECDSLLIVDLLAVFSALGSKKGALERVRKIDKLVALDVWDMGGGNRTLDIARTERTLPKGTLLTPKRLVPWSAIQPHADSMFRPFPALPEGDASARRAGARRALGIAKDERVLLVTTSSMQLDAAHADAAMKKLLRRVSRLCVERVAAIENVRVLHVGPAPLPWTEPLGDRYTWLVPPGTKHLHNRFAAADAVFVLDSTAWSIDWAAAWSIPAMALVNGADMKTPDTHANMPFTLTEGTRAWLADSTPLPRFRVCPLGLWKAVEPTAVEAPYVQLELLDETSFHDTCRALLFDQGERERAVRDSASCIEEAATLPTAGELWEKLASS